MRTLRGLWAAGNGGEFGDYRLKEVLKIELIGKLFKELDALHLVQLSQGKGTVKALLMFQMWIFSLVDIRI